MHSDFMKVQETDPQEQLIQLLKERIGEKNFSSITTSLGTMADIMARHLMVQHPSKLPSQVKYAILQTFAYLQLIGMAFHNPEKLKEGIEALHFQTYDPGEDLDAEERFIFTVKAYYLALLQQGKIKDKDGMD